MTSPPLRSAMMAATDFLDYRLRPRWDHGTGNIPQIMYPLLIEKRLEASRSWNEFSETATRDSIGMVSWLWGIPIGERLFVAMKTPKALQEVLITRYTGALKVNAGWLQQMEHRFKSSLIAGSLLSSKSLIHRIKLLEKLPDQQKVAPALSFLRQAKHYRDTASLLGLGISFAVLGVGVNIYNVLKTRQAVDAEKQRRLAKKQPD